MPVESCVWPARPTIIGKAAYCERMSDMTLRKHRSAPTRLHNRRTDKLDPIKRPERLVGLGFRCWLAGYETHDVNCWETGWNTFASELGPADAKTAITELSCWVRQLHQTACRQISYFPYGCKGFCQDECMAISMIAASQHSACPAMRACAFALLNSNNIDSVVDSATNFGNALRDAGQVLSDQSICNASALTGLTAPQQEHGKH